MKECSPDGINWQPCRLPGFCGAPYVRQVKDEDACRCGVAGCQECDPPRERAAANPYAEDPDLARIRRGSPAMLKDRPPLVEAALPPYYPPSS